MKNKSRWDVLALFISFLRVNWWKITVLMLVSGIILCGFTVKGKNFQCEKEPLKLQELKK